METDWIQAHREETYRTRWLFGYVWQEAPDTYHVVEKEVGVQEHGHVTLYIPVEHALRLVGQPWLKEKK